MAERANSIQSGQPINDGERPIVPERVAMPCDARSSLFVVIGSPGARMKALRADDTDSHRVVRAGVDMSQERARPLSGANGLLQLGVAPLFARAAHLDATSAGGALGRAPTDPKSVRMRKERSPPTK